MYYDLDPLSPFKSLQMGMTVFHGKRLEPRVLPWQQHGSSHSVSFVVYVSGAGFDERCSNVSGDVLD